MRPVTLELEGFLSYKAPTTISFEGLAAVAILGENGAGKTSIVEAMAWALFGKGRGRRPDDFVSLNATRCRVSFTFEMSGGEYRVERQRELGKAAKSYLGLFTRTSAPGMGEPNWYPIGGDSIAESQGAIEQLVGMDYAMWHNTSFLGQNAVDSFTRLAPGERKELLAEVLDLSSYQAVADVAHDRAKELSGSVTALRPRAQVLEDQLAGRPEVEKVLAQARDQHSAAEEWVRRAEAEAEAAQVAVIEAERAAAAVDEAARRVADKRAELERDHRFVRELEALIPDLEAARERLPGLRDQALKETELALHERGEADQILTEASGIEGEARAAHDRGLALQPSIIELRERAALLEREGAACFVCGQPLTEDQRERLLVQVADQNARAVQDVEAFAAEASTKEAEAGALRREAQDKVQAAESRARRAREIELAAAQAEAAAGRIDAEQARIAEAKRSAERTMADLQALEPSAQGAAGARARVDEEATRARAARSEVGSARETLTRHARDVARAENSLEALDAAESELDRLDQQIVAGDLHSRRLGLIAEAFGRDGIPALVIENAVPEIEEEANRLLERLTDGRLTVALRSVRATKSGGLRETLDVTVADDTAERPLDNFSGGERQAVDLALRIGLSRLLARRAGRSIDMLIVDEGFTALDSTRRQRALEAIHALTETFPVVLFITHLPEFGDAFPARIEVRKEDGTSRVEVMAS